MKNRGSTPILTNAVGVHPRNIHTKFEANPCSGLRGEVEKLKSSRRQQRQRRQRQRRRRTQPDRYSHTHSLSVTKKACFCLPCRVGSVSSVSASHTVGREFASRPGHTKDHHKNGTNCLPA